MAKFRQIWSHRQVRIRLDVESGLWNTWQHTRGSRFESSYWQIYAAYIGLTKAAVYVTMYSNLIKMEDEKSLFVLFSGDIFSKGHLRSAKLLAKVESHEAVSEILFWIPCTNSNSKVLPDLPWSSLVEGDEQANWPSSQIWMHVLHIFGTLCPQQLSTCADTSLHLLLLAPWACWHSFQTECSSASIYSLW